MQKILTMETGRDCVRAKVLGWGCDDSELFISNKPIGLTPPPNFNYTYNTVLEALAHGWKLLSPPQKIEHHDGIITYDWWLVKD